jgi:hypothetical protein
MSVFPFGMEGALTKAQVRSELAAYEGQLADAWHGAWNEWMSLPAESRAKIGPMQRGGVVHDFAVDRATGFFPGDQGATTWVCRDGFWKLYVNDKIVIRLKKLRADGSIPLGGKSEATRRYYKNSSLPNVRNHCHRLSAGYLLNAVETEIEEVRIVYQLNDQVIWSYSIDEGGIQTQFHETPGDSDTPPPQPNVTLAEDDDQNAAAEG